MANGSGLTADGDGSVQWSAINVEDDIRKSEAFPYGEQGRSTKGADKLHGEFFKIDLIVPETWTTAFVNQFTGAEGKKPGEVVTVYLPIAKVPKQIEVHWTPGIVPPPDDTRKELRSRPLTAE